MRLKRTVLWDMDGTLTNPEPYQHFLETKPKDWDSWNAQIPHHEPHQDMVDLFKELWRSGWQNIIITARAENCRGFTEMWLRKHNMMFMHTGLYMRAREDRRPDFEVKKDILLRLKERGVKPAMAFDDKSEVVNMYRENGVRCLQVC